MTFDGVVDVYERVRPSYPPELFDQLFASLPSKPRILEVGPGTGQATRSLLEREATVTAVELGPNLAERLRSNFADEAALTVINAAFEDASVEANSFDAVVVATAYHWITADAQITRPLEVLRRGGVLGVIDLIQVDSASDHGYFERVLGIYDRYQGPRRPDEPKTHETAQPPIVRHLRSSGEFGRIQVHRVPWDQTYTSAQYRDLLWSYSGTQMMAEPDRSSMVDELVAVIDEELGGQLTRPLVATLTLARTPI